ncbi:chromosomal replication initiator protein DnaA [Desulfopila inferna]|uniref:chromosomal replication initiator protein DnaA n=1 Tax=Desulfopila inferna TaxID=468528 RepID=UPI00196553D6|nr:chromosomal replication initiator protein DnaA [Desulfopila inferna]MBM9605042.1 chromosomal replication initiator protein DnaA [Desulfopila inferna]
MVWQKAKEILRDELSESVYSLWIDPLECSGLQEDKISLCCPDRFFSAYVARNYLEIIQAKLSDVDPQRREVILTLGRGAAQAPAGGKSAQLRLPNVPRNSSSVRALHPRYTFAEFMVGESNILAQSACRSITLADDSIGPCLYINSSTGLGKSHLTHAVAHQILAEAPMTRLHYLTAQQFSYEMVNNIKANTMDSFKQKYHEQCDILLVEDVHSLTGKKKTQEELNELLDSLIKCGKRIVFTANRPPRDLIGIDEEFRSRMAAGLVTAIQPPDISTRTRIVKNKAQQHNLKLEEEHIDYLAQHIKGDIRQVESAIVGIRAKAHLQEGVVDMSLVEQVIAALVGLPKSLSPALIREFICKQYKVSCDELQSRSRKKALTFPRQVAMYLCRKHTENSLNEIGKEFNRDHSTVLHSIKVVTGLTNRNISVGEQINLLSKKLKTL